MRKFLRDTIYYCALLPKYVPEFGANTFKVSYKQGAKIILENPYNPEIRVSCELSKCPNWEIITFPNGQTFGRNFCQEKYGPGKFEALDLGTFVEEEYDF